LEHWIVIEPGIANAADYADALLTARKAKNILVLLLLVVLLFQLGLFFVARYRMILDGGALAGLSGTVESGGRPASSLIADLLKYVVGLTDFLGVVVPILLLADLWLIASVMLLGRLLGVSRVIAAFLWCMVLLTLLFPWQAFLMNQTFTSTQFEIPGVLYTWLELVVRGRVHPSGFSLSLLYWARFVGWPVVATVLLLSIQHLSGTGLRAALGEAAKSSPDVRPAGA
jgi:hypothetical protein